MLSISENKELCEKYNQLREAGKDYKETMQELSKEYSYKPSYMQVIVDKAFRVTGMEKVKGSGTTHETHGNH